MRPSVLRRDANGSLPACRIAGVRAKILYMDTAEIRVAGLCGAYAFVDLETTGCNPVYDRITEIAIVSVRDGAVVERWQQLVDPGMSIPDAIQSLTGITNAMVAGQPAFEDVATEVHRRLDGVTFVAHNARFDHGFLRNALKRCGLGLRGPVLCTVKLSRRLFPQHARHNLDAIIQRHGIACAARHRALGDAEATWRFVADVAATDACGLLRHIEELTRRPALPPRLAEPELDALPDTPGVYLFFDERETPLYVGKSVRLRSRVLSHFAADHSSHREMQMAQQTARVEWRECAGELGALLRESQLVKELTPVYNRQLRRQAELVSIRWRAEVDAIPEVVAGARIASEGLRELHGLFRSRAQARKVLLALADEHRLCLRLCGLEKKASGACFRYQVGKCRGACAGHEHPLQHQARLAAALAGLKLVSWPWDGAIGIVERHPDGWEEMHVVDRWCYLGSFRSEDELRQRDLFERAPAFDMDTYKLLVKHLLRGRAPRVVPLSARRDDCLPASAGRRQRGAPAW